MDPSALLKSQGWRGLGHSLHAHDDSVGLLRPILFSQKQNMFGVGTTRHTSDQWWMSAFDEQLKGMTSMQGGAGVAFGRQGGELAKIQGHHTKYGVISSASGTVFGGFVRGGMLEGTIDEVKGGQEDEEEAEEEETLPESSESTSTKKKETKENRRARREARRKARRARAEKRLLSRGDTIKKQRDCGEEGEEEETPSASDASTKARKGTKEERRAIRDERRAMKESRRAIRAERKLAIRKNGEDKRRKRKGLAR